MEQDYLREEEKRSSENLPGNLNVLTILTFIGSAVAGLLTAFTPWVNKILIEKIDVQLASGKLSEKDFADKVHAKEMLEKVNDNIIPFMSIGLIGVILCIVGALWMRKLKKDGFWIYTAGELSPVIAAPFIMGVEYYQTIGGIIGLLISIIFMVMYTMQRKYLVH